MGIVSKAFIALGLMSFACSTPPPPPKEQSPPDVVNGVRQKPLTAEEVTQILSRNADKFEDCFRRERANFTFDQLGEYVFRVQIPPDGSKVRLGLIKETQPDQKSLRMCMVDVLRGIKFPIHAGNMVTIDVPIRGARN